MATGCQEEVFGNVLLRELELRLLAHSVLGDSSVLHDDGACSVSPALLHRC
jgi:hypothetical protein